MYFWINFKQICNYDCTKHFGLFFWSKYLKQKHKYLNITLKIIEKPFRVEAALAPNNSREVGVEPTRFFVYVYGIFQVFVSNMCLCLENRREGGFEPTVFFVFKCFFHFSFGFSIFFKQKQILEKYRNKYRKHIRKKTFRLETTLPAKNWFPFMNCYYCIFSTKTNTGKDRKIPDKYRKPYPKKTFRPETTLPAQIYSFAWVPSKNKLFHQNRTYSPTVGRR